MDSVSITISNQYYNTGNPELSKVTVGHDSVVYNAITESGAKLPSGCLAGSCGVCAAFIVKGAENLKPPGAVERDTIAHLSQRYEDMHKEKPPHPMRLTCRAKVQGHITIAPFSL